MRFIVKVALVLLAVTVCCASSSNTAAQSPDKTKKAGAATKPKETPGIVEIDFDNPATEKIVVPAGWMIRIVATRRPRNVAGGTNPAIHTLRMEVTGEFLQTFPSKVQGKSLETFPTVVSPQRVRRKDFQGRDSVTTTTAFLDHICHLRAVRDGVSNLKITVVELDGKLGESKEWKVFVVTGKGRPKPPPNLLPDPAPLQLLYLDLKLEKKPNIKVKRPAIFFMPWTEIGSMLQLEVVCPSDKKDKDYIETFQLRVDGDSVRVVETVASVYRERTLKSKGLLVEDPTRRHVKCLLVTTKKGSTWLDVTLLGADGMPISTRLLEICVGVARKKLPVP